MPDNLRQIPTLAKFRAALGYNSSAPKETGEDFMVSGSENAMLTGTGKTQAFKGVTERVGENGGIVMMNVVEEYASLGRTSDLTAYGNVFNVFSALFYIGKGLLRLQGVSLLVNASATLSLLIKRSGSYTDALSGPWQAGLAVPSAPIIRAVTPPAGMIGKVNGVVSVVIWRIRSTTGATSNRSEVSNFVGAVNESIAVAFPLIDANGQDYWGVGVTKHGEGKTGSHFEYIEISEATVAGSNSRADAVTNAASLDVTSVTGGFTSTHIGWVATFSGGSPGISFSSYVTAVPSATTITLADMPPTSSTGVTLVLTQGEAGQERTVVIEWRDGDLVGKPFAPSRSFPPPAGLFAGSLEDITFVDGCYADAVEATDGDSYSGSSIAPSEKGKPESFSPDNVIPTNSIPTALVRGDGLYWRTSRNDVMVIRYLPGEQPLSVEIVWEGIGVEYQHNVCLGEGGRLYLWPSERGAMRMGDDGLPDTGFANEVADDLALCTDASKRVVGWYGLMQAVVYMYGDQAWPFFTNLGKWGAPAMLNIEGTYIRSCVADNNQLLITDNLDNLYEYNVGTGSVMKIRTNWVTAQESTDTVALVTASVRTDNELPIDISVFADGDGDTAVETMSVEPSRVGYQQLPSIWPNVAQCHSHALEIVIESTTATGDVGLESIDSFGETDGIII